MKTPRRAFEMFRNARGALLLVSAACALAAQTPPPPTAREPATSPETAFHLAVRNRELETAKTLLAAQPDLVRSVDSFQQTPLHVAATNGDTAMVEFLLNNGADLDAESPLSSTPLAAATLAGHVATVELLLARGAKVNTADRQGASPLARAVLTGSMPIVEMLVARGAKVRSPNAAGLAPLRLAVIAGRTEMVKFLLQHGAELQTKAPDGGSLLHDVVRIVDAPQFLAAIMQGLSGKDSTPEYRKMVTDVVGDTARELFVSSATQRAAMAALLIDQGLDVMATDSAGETPLHAAARKGEVAVIDVLLEHGAKVDAVDHAGYTALNTAAEKNRAGVVEKLLAANASIRIKANDGRSPLYSAAMAGGTAIVTLLLDRKSDVNEAERSHRRTALHAAALYGHDDVVKLLLERGADPRALSDDGCTPLHYAAALRLDPNRAAWERQFKQIIGTGHAAAVQLLIDHHAPIDAQGSSGMTALHYAALNGHDAGLALLLAHKANKEARTVAGFTALHMAAQAGFAGSIKLLLDHGADIAALDHNQWTALHHAAVGGHGDAAEMLLARGAKVDAEVSGHTQAIHQAAANGSVAVLKALLAHGAKIDAVEEHLATPLHLAAMRRHAAAVQLLLEQGAAVDAIDFARQTALHQAATSGDAASARILLEHHCPVDARARDGDTALHFAVMVRTARQPPNTPVTAANENERLALVKLLIAAGADLNATTRVNQTPFDVALTFGTPALARLVRPTGVPAGSAPATAVPTKAAPARGSAAVVTSFDAGTLSSIADSRHVSGDFASALDEYEQMIRSTKEDLPYPKIFRYLIQRRLQREGAEAQLTRDLAAWRATWTKTIAQFLLGQVSEANFYAIARATSKPPRALPCEAYYFAGMKALLSGDREKAQRDFEQCLATKEDTRLAFSLAKAELGRLANSR